MRAHWRRHGGFTLVEIMVALVLGLVLTAGAAYLFISHKRTYGMGEAVARIQESGRYAIDTLSRDLRMAGHLGCADPVDVNVVATSSVTGQGGASDFAYVATAVRVPSGGQDRLSLRYATPGAVPLASDMSSDTATIVLDESTDLQAGDLALITDCTRADLFTVSAVSADGRSLSHAVADGDGNTVNQTGALSHAYQQADTEVMGFVVRDYVVGPTGRTNDVGDSIDALADNDGELLPGVERMVVEFGERTGASSTRFRAWSNVADPACVAAVRVGFLMHSIDPVLDDPANGPYTVLGTSITPASDARLRQVFSTTVNLRNQASNLEDC